jgi:uncharacterized protein involved in exopolysaccharide biosynthesis
MSLPARNTTPDGETPPIPLGSRSYAVQRPAPSSLTDSRGPIYQDDAPVFVLANLRIAAGFPARALKRHRKLAWALLGSLLSLLALAILITPRHYTIETKFFAEKNFVLPALGNPKRAVPTESDSPTRLASDAVMKRSNLVEIIRQTKLLDSWDEMRSPLGKIKDAVMQSIKGPMTESDRLEAMLGMIEKRLWVKSEEEGTVLIGVDWPDPVLGFRMVQAAQQNFFEQRHAQEVSLIGESIGILESHVATSQKAIQDALTQINASLPKSRAVTLPFSFGSRAPAVAAGPSAAVVALQSELRAKETTLADITTSRNQRIVAQQTTLSELRGKYGSAHPDIAAAEENLRALNEASPQLNELRADVTALRSRLTTMGERADGAAAVAASAASSFERDALAALALSKADTAEAPEVTFARSRLKIATTDFEDFSDRLESARIEMETARAGFKYRYNLILPARIPREAKWPKIPLMIIGGLILSLLATAFTVVMLDLGSGRVIEPWQVDRQLGLPVLAEVKRR